MSEEKQPLETIRKGRAAVIRLIRPERKNRLSAATLEALRTAFARLEADPDVDTLIFTGSEKSFAAGADLREVAALDENSARAFGRRGQELMLLIHRSRKPTIAAIDGFCMGGALDLALSCRRRIASPDSFFAHPGAGLGIITGWGGTQFLPRLIGRKPALEMFLTAKRVPADEALRMGLIDAIDPQPLAKALGSCTK